MTTELDIAWFAGLMEGEGSFTLKDSAYPRLSMQLTDLDVLEKVKRLFGGHIYECTKREEHHKQCWAWVLTDLQTVVALSKSLLPFLGQRRAGKATECIVLGEALLDKRSNKVTCIKRMRDLVHELHSTGNYTHQDIATTLGVDRSYVSHILGGRYKCQK
jgi:hypothetical protein